MQNLNVPALLVGLTLFSPAKMWLFYGGDYVLLDKVKKATRRSLGADPPPMCCHIYTCTLQEKA